MGNLNIDVAFFLKYLFTPPPMIWWALWLTISIALVAQTLGVALGLIVALARMSGRPWLSWLARLYIWFWRGTPLLVQLVLIYTGVAAAGFYRYPEISFGPFSISGPLQAAIIALSLHEAAYMAEIFRAALSSIDKGQYDAARAIGMRPLNAMRWIILPQAIRIVIPPLGNELTLMIKGTSLLAVIGIRELFGTIQQLNAATFRTFELFVIAAIWYLILTSIMSVVQRLLEKRLGRYEVASQTLSRRPYGEPALAPGEH
jgi:polar amino acid transport system permease protein